jgi:hypothetical protein
MRADLLEAKSSVDWVWSQLPGLVQRVEAWLNEHVVVELRDPGDHATHNLIIGVEKELLPLSFNVETGAYINAIRSSLDILAMALVRRNGSLIKEDEVYFPIARSEASFKSAMGSAQKILDALGPQERRTIEALDPYQGGNQNLWTLHHLDIVRKHRRLLSVVLRPMSISLQGTLAPGDFEPLAVDAVHVNDETIIGMLRKGVDAKLVRSKFYVALDEELHIGRRPVSAVLGYLANMAENVITLFDF